MVPLHTGQTVEIPSPFVDHATLEGAAEAAGFELTVPETVDGSSMQSIQTMDGEMIQVLYGDEDHQILIRKAPGGEDISGDFHAYAQVREADVNGADVTMKGENDVVYLAIWARGGYTYSISARAGLGEAEMTALVQSVQ